MSTFAFETTWGANVRAHGGTRFRLWAPAQERVSLFVPNASLVVPMGAVGEGWFELQTDAVEIGEGYSFRLADGMHVPDPAARAQIDDVHGPSRLVDPRSYDWRCAHWQGRPWEEAVIYELHAGTFSPEGTFEGILNKLNYLSDLGVTAIEIMPVAQFAGRRGWGYDGVLLYAPHNAYGGPDGLKRLVDAAHQRNLMVLLDVVYNHFGPDGNYLHLYAPDFFHRERKTPWGAAIAYEKAAVREFFIENALYWLQEYQLDGLRLDAINQIEDQAEVPLLEQLARRVRQTVTGRPIHLTTEDDRNIVRLHQRDDQGRVQLFTAEWNDDFHHAAHVLATSESDGYYQDYRNPVPKLARALAEGFVYQGEPSPFWDGAVRGEPSIDQPPTAFIDFLQNHDQIGNRAFGERLTALAPEQTLSWLTAVLLLSPHIPLLFMGEEWGARRPFYFFTDFDGELAKLVREGRRNEFKKWPAFQDQARREQIPDPNAEATFTACVLDWDASEAGHHAERLQHVRSLLRLRVEQIVPRMRAMRGGQATYEALGDNGLHVTWKALEDALVLLANFGPSAIPINGLASGPHKVLYDSALSVATQPALSEIAPWSVLFLLREAGAS